MRIIPAIDIIEGQCVRLHQGDYGQKKTYSSRPLEVAKAFEDAGIRHLHLVDLDGAKARKIVNLQVLEEICSKTQLAVDFGGGISSIEEVEKALNAGAKQVTCGSIAAKQPKVFLEWLAEFGPERLILGADAKDRMIATTGWLETSSMDVLIFIRDYAEKGVQYVICTDIGRDGTLSGPAFELYSEILQASPAIHLIASGGVSCFEDLTHLQSIGMEGAIIGKAFYEGKITLQQLSSLC